jgi:hypothetical protein
VKQHQNQNKIVVEKDFVFEPWLNMMLEDERNITIFNGD